MAIEIKPSRFTSRELSLARQLNHSASFLAENTKIYQMWGSVDRHLRNSKGEILGGVTVNEHLLTGLWTATERSARDLRDLGRGEAVERIINRYLKSNDRSSEG